VLRSDGSPERDFLYVEDAAAAYLLLADNLDRDEVRGEAFNAGGGRAYSVREVVEILSG
jgi:CDP-glucose 4,6-dehydratase